MNQYNNDTLPYQQKIVGVELPDDTGEVTEALKFLAEIFSSLYGIVIAIFGNDRFIVKLNPNVPIKTMMIAEKISVLDDISQEVEIIPFPKR